MSDSFFYQGFNTAFSSIGFIVGLGFLIVLTIIILRIIKGMMIFVSNNNSPKVSIEAKIIDKRGDVSIYRHSNASGHVSNSSSTTYYISFELITHERIELKVPHDQYGLLIIGDSGTLNYQGTRFLSFERTI